MVNRRSGFTLIELLVVLGVLAITLPTILMVATYTTNMRNEARLRTGATLLAEAKMEELLAYSDHIIKEEWPQLSESRLAMVLKDQDEEGTGAFTDELSTPYSWHWYSVPEDVGEVGEQVSVSRILVRVRWVYRGQTQSVRTETYARTDSN